MRFPCLITCLALVVAAFAGCDRAKYAQSTPDEVIAAAKTMVQSGEASKLSTLLYAENDSMRRLYGGVGRLLGNIQILGVEINKRWPEEVEKIRIEAETAAKSGKAPSILSQLGQGGRGRNRRTPGQPAPAGGGRSQQAAVSAMLKGLFVDPYAFLEEQSGRLTTVMVTDDTAAVMWDGKPIPPLGLAMRRAEVDGKQKWFIVPPTNIPVISRYMPKSESQFKVWGSLIKTLDNAVVELASDVKSGAATSIDDVSSKAGEKLFIPAAMTFYALGKVSESKSK